MIPCTPPCRVAGFVFLHVLYPPYGGYNTNENEEDFAQCKKKSRAGARLWGVLPTVLFK